MVRGRAGEGTAAAMTPHHRALPSRDARAASSGLRRTSGAAVMAVVARANRGAGAKACAVAANARKIAITLKSTGGGGGEVE